MRLSSHVVASLTVHLPAWLEGVASRGLSVLVVIALVLGAWLVFMALAGVIAGPFCEMLSEAVGVQLTGHEGPAFSFPRFIRELTIGIRNVALPPVGGSSYVQYAGSDLVANAPYLQLGVCE